MALVQKGGEEMGFTEFCAARAATDSSWSHSNQRIETCSDLPAAVAVKLSGSQRQLVTSYADDINHPTRTTRPAVGFGGQPLAYD